MPDTRYTIKRGDTLWDLARKYGTTVDELMRLNPQISDRNMIYAGRKLTLPAAGPATAASTQPSPGGPPAAQAVSSPADTLKPETGLPPGPPFAPQAVDSRTADQGALTGLTLPPAFPNENPTLNPVQQDAAMAARGMQATPELQALMAAGLLPAMVRGIPALAAMAPRALPPAGQFGNAMVKGAVPSAAATPSAMNVAPIAGGQAASNAVVQGMRQPTLQEMIQAWLSRPAPPSPYANMLGM